MTYWALVVKELDGTGQTLHWNARLIGTLAGTREEALAMLQQYAQFVETRHPAQLERRVVCRDGDDGFFVMNTGRTRDFPCEFRIYEIVSDSAPPPSGYPPARSLPPMPGVAPPGFGG